MADCLNNEEQVVSGLSSENEDSLKSEINNGDLLSSNVDNGDIVTSNAVLDEAISSTIQEDGAINSTLDLPITTSGSTVNVIDNLMSTDTKSALSANQGRVLNELINGVKTDLENYYTQSEVNSLITAIPKFAIKVVNSLPSENISTATVYLLASGSESQNLYTEYIYINGVWEKLGEQKVDLSGYQTIEDFNTAIAGYYTKTEIDTMVEQINEGLVKELQSPINVYNTPEGIYRIPANSEILYVAMDPIPNDAYLFISDTSENYKFFTTIYNTHNAGELVQQYMGFGKVRESGNGYYYVTNLSSLTGYVDTSTDQEIHGQKTIYNLKTSTELPENLDNNRVVSAEWVNDKLDGKQDTLTAGNNITINEGIISAELSDSAPIILLGTEVRIWNLDSGIYKVPEGATIYYSGATSASSIPYFNSTSAILIVNNLAKDGDVHLPYPYKKYILFATIQEGLQKSGFITGKVLADTGSYHFFSTEENAYVKTSSVNTGNVTRPFDTIPYINSAGVMEVGTYVDFHSDNTTGNDYSTRLYSNGENKNAVKLPSGSGTLALTTDNVASATKATQDGDGNVISNTYVKNSKIKNVTTSTLGNDTGWNAGSYGVNIPSLNTIAYWDGRYASDMTKGNLAYCNKGAFGDMATKTASDYTLNANNILSGYGTCSTGASTSAKVVTITDTNWTLKVGTVIGVKFTNSNTASNVTLNVNSTGAKSIYYNNAKYTGSGSNICGYANRLVYYMYDGTYWVWISSGYEFNDNTIPSGYCTTAGGTQAKTAYCNAYSLPPERSKSYLQVIVQNANTYAGAITLNVNGKGAKPIYINGVASSSTNYTLPAGSYLTYYDGANYYFRTDGKLPSASTSLVPKGDYDTLSATSGNTYTAPANGWFAWSMESTSNSYSHVSLTNNTNGMMIRHAQTATGAGNRGVFPAKKGDVVKFESSNNKYNWFRFYYGEEV